MPQPHVQYVNTTVKLHSMYVFKVCYSLLWLIISQDYYPYTHLHVVVIVTLASRATCMEVTDVYETFEQMGT